MKPGNLLDRFGKKKKRAFTPKASKKGNSSVSSFFLPVFPVVVLIILMLFIGGSWWMHKSEREQLLSGLATTAGSMAQLFEARVGGAKTTVKLLAQDKELISALASRQDVTRVQKRLKQQLPAADKLLVIPAETKQGLVLETLSGSYLALSLHQRVTKTGAIPAVEALKTENQSVFIISVPIKQKDQVLGSLIAYYQIEMLSRSLRYLQLGNGVIGLEQTADNKHLLLAGSPGYKRQLTSASLPVKNTLWQIRYGLPDSDSGLGEMLPLIALALAAALLIYLVLHKQQKKLSHAIKTDMGTAVSLVDATLKRTGSPEVRPSIEETSSALELLRNYAKASFTLAKAGGNDSIEGGAPPPAPGRTVEPGKATTTDSLPDEIFLANDIRGISGRTLTPGMAQQLGMAVGTLALSTGESSVLVGHDARLSSEELSSSMIAGILSTGCDVQDLGMVPVPLLYFATQVLPGGSCVMTTGGHNPAEYNGFKITIDGSSLIEQDLLGLREIVESGNLKTGVGSLVRQDLSERYISQVAADIQLLEPRRVVVDGGNGAGAVLLVRLLQELGCDVIELFCNPDGTFPNHFPDPANPDNLSALAVEVLAQGADFGVALDGDGDCLALVDERGEQVATDFLFMLLATDVVMRNPGADVIYDVKSSSYLASHILSNGGRPVMWKTGHALMKLRMQETGALLGGEYSGHFYIKDRWHGFDDAVYAAARLLELFSMSPQPVSAFFTALPRGASSGALELEMPRDKADSLLQSLAQRLAMEKVDVSNLDGLRIEYSDGWSLVRLSNTLPRLVFRFEGKDELALENARTHLRNQIQRIEPELVLPF